MKLLFITRKVDKDDGLAGFTYYWIKKMAGQVERLDVICLEKGNTGGLAANTSVHSLGKEAGKNRWREFWRFQKLAWHLVPRVDGIFSHQNPEYGILIAPYAKLFGKKLIAWYAHGAISGKLRLLNFLADRVVTSTEAGFKLPSHKKIVLHQGIDAEIFNFKKREAHPEIRLLSVSRISSVKGLEKMVGLVGHLEQKHNKKVILKIVGQPILEKDTEYFANLQKQVRELGLTDSVEFLGSVANDRTPQLYQWADVFLNFSHTASLDKTILEAMSCGSLVFTTNESAKSILAAIDKNLVVSSFNNLSEQFLALLKKDSPALRERLHQEVRQKHDLAGLMKEIIRCFKQIL